MTTRFTVLALFTPKSASCIIVDYLQREFTLLMVSFAFPPGEVKRAALSQGTHAVPDSRVRYLGRINAVFAGPRLHSAMLL